MTTNKFKVGTEVSREFTDEYQAFYARSQFANTLACTNDRKRSNVQTIFLRITYVNVL